MPQASQARRSKPQNNSQARQADKRAVLLTADSIREQVANHLWEQIPEWEPKPNTLTNLAEQVLARPHKAEWERDEAFMRKARELKAQLNAKERGQAWRLLEQLAADFPDPLASMVRSILEDILQNQQETQQEEMDSLGLATSWIKSVREIPRRIGSEALNQWLNTNQSKKQKVLDALDTDFKFHMQSRVLARLLDVCDEYRLAEKNQAARKAEKAKPKPSQKVGKGYEVYLERSKRR